MHDKTARTIALLLALLVAASFVFVGISYLEKRTQVIAAHRAEQRALAVKPPADPRKSVERKYVPPAPIRHPFY